MMAIKAVTSTMNKTVGALLILPAVCKRENISAPHETIEKATPIVLYKKFLLIKISATNTE